MVTMRFLACMNLIFISALALLVSMRLLSGQINTAGLLHQTNLRTHQLDFSPARVQLLLVTLYLALDYLLKVIAHPDHFPDFSHQLLILQGGSSSGYLLAKFRALLRHHFI